MIHETAEAGLRGVAETRLQNAACWAACSALNTGIPAEKQRPSPVSDSRLRRLARQIHALGERPLYELFRELERGVDLHDALDRYARLADLAGFIAQQGGDRLRPQLWRV